MKTKNKKVSSSALLTSKLSNLIKDRWNEYKKSDNTSEYHIHYGPTNSGKSFHALKAARKASSALILSPLRLLAHEYRNKLQDVGPNGELPVLCSLITGEEKIIVEGARHVSSTAEIFSPSKDNRYDCIVLDETQMISDEHRGHAWTNVIMNAVANEIHIITAPEALNIIKKILDGCGKKYELHEYKRLVPLVVADKPVDINKPEPGTIFVTFSRKSVLELKNFFDGKGIKASAMYGAMPPQSRVLQLERFNSGENAVAVTTDVIGMGLNTVCHNIVFMTTIKYDGKEEKRLSITQLKQIAGRAGRYLLSEKGVVGATNAKDLEWIRENLNKEAKEITRVKIEPVLEDLEAVQEDTIYKKLVKWSNTIVIPSSLKSIVSTISLEEHITLANLISHKEYRLLGLEKCYELVKAPTTKDTIEYWQRCFKAIVEGKEIPLPGKISLVKSQDELYTAEKLVKQCDLYLWLHNKQTFKKFAPEGENVTEHKYYLAKMIDKALVSNLSLAKTCRQCKVELDRYHAFNICDDCHDEMY